MLPFTNGPRANCVLTSVCVKLQGIKRNREKWILRKIVRERANKTRLANFNVT